MTPRLKWTRAKIVRKKQMRPEIMFFPDSKIKTYFPFTLQSSSCPSMQMLYTHLCVYIYMIYICVYMWGFLPQGKAMIQTLQAQQLLRVCLP